MGPAEWLVKEDYEDLFAVNLLGVIDMTVTFLPLIKKAKGRIVNTSSMAGRVSFAETAPYSITKYGVEAFSDSIRQHSFYVPQGIWASLFAKKCVLVVL